MNAARRRSQALRRFAGSITLVTVLGHTLLGFEQAYLTPIVGAVTGVTAKLVLETVEAWAWRRPARYLRTRPSRVTDFFLPSYITGLTCAMLLYGDAHPMPVVLAVLIGVGSTYVLRVRARSTHVLRGSAPGGAKRLAGGPPGRHYMNPPCFGVVAVLLLFPWVGVAPPYQFTEWVSGPFDVLVPLAALSLGTVANARLTGRLPLVLGWVGGFVLQGIARGALTDVSTVDALLPMTGVAFVLYTTYLITDPGTTPVRPRAQATFGLATAAVYGLLVQLHVGFGLLLALVIVCAGRGAGLALLARLRPRAVPVPTDARELSEVPAGVQP